MSASTNPDRRKELERDYSRIIAKTWQDEAFKQRLIADPVAALSEIGVALPTGRTIRVVENTDEVFHLVLKPRPADLIIEELGSSAQPLGSCVATECDICATE